MLLNKGEQINKSEVIRDFDGWSWNTAETKYDISSLIYVGMTYVLTYDQLENNKKSSTQNLNNILNTYYKQAFSEKILKTICQIAISDYIMNNEHEKDVINKKRKKIEEDFKQLEDKKTFIERITQEKKKCISECCKIDKYLNNDLLLKKEYIRQNEKLPQNERVFSLSDFSEKIQNQKDELERKIEDLTQKIKPKNYINEKNKLEKEFLFYNEINVENNNLSDFIDEFINLLFKAITEQVKKTTLKKEIIEKLYMVRYLNLYKLFDTTIGEKYKKQINKLQKDIITKACNLKALTIFSQDISENYLIYNNIFRSKIIDLDSMYIEITKDNTIRFYDDEAMDIEEKQNGFKDLIERKNKKIKIII